MVGSSVPASAPPPQATSAVAISSERVTKVVDGWWTGWRGEAGVGIEVDMLDFIETTGRVTRTAPQGKRKKREEKAGTGKLELSFEQGSAEPEIAATYGPDGRRAEPTP